MVQSLVGSFFPKPNARLPWLLSIIKASRAFRGCSAERLDVGISKAGILSRELSNCSVAAMILRDIFSWLMPNLSQFSATSVGMYCPSNKNASSPTCNSMIGKYSLVTLKSEIIAKAVT